jgi:Flp pilus assembly protein TadB
MTTHGNRCRCRQGLHLAAGFSLYRLVSFVTGCLLVAALGLVLVGQTWLMLALAGGLIGCRLAYGRRTAKERQ